MNKVLASIITYNPDIPLLRKDISSICNQVSGIVIFDNCSSNVNEIEELASEFDNVTVVKNTKNVGLPKNYNRAAKLALKKGCEWLMILDQDSIMPSNIIERLSEYFNDKKVAIVCPQFRDVNLYSEEEFKKIIPDEDHSLVEQCISSASVNRVSIIKELGGFDEKLFIDQVDYDYCRNVREHGYNIIQVNDCIIDHSIGKSRYVKFFGKKLLTYNHSPIRKYYFFRNRIYFARKYHITPFNNIRFFTSLGSHFIALFYEENKKAKIKNALKGIKDGFKL